MNERALRVDGLRVRCLEQGKGAAVLLLHGASLGSSADVWARNLAPLAAHGLRVIAPDLPGFGHTENPADHSLAYRQRFVLALMDALELDRASLVGHSQAGRIAVELAFREPQRVAKLVVLATGSLLPPLESATAEGDEGTAGEPTLDETRALLEANLYNKALDGDEADTGEVMQVTRVEVLREHGARADADRARGDERKRCAGEHRPAAHCLVGGEEERRELRLVAELGDEYGGEHGAEHLEIHGDS